MSRAKKKDIRDAFGKMGEDTEATRKGTPATQGQVNAETLLDLIRQPKHCCPLLHDCRHNVTSYFMFLPP